MNPSRAWDGMANLLVSEESRKEFASLRRTFDEVNHDLKTKFSQELLIKERLPLVASAPPSSSSPMICEKEVEEDNESWRSGEGLWELILELVMWENAAKSSLWFGLGTMFFISSCFSMDVGFSMISAFSHLG